MPSSAILPMTGMHVTGTREPRWNPSPFSPVRPTSSSDVYQDRSGVPVCPLYVGWWDGRREVCFHCRHVLTAHRDQLVEQLHPAGPFLVAPPVRQWVYVP